MEVSMIWTSIAVTIICIGPIAWLFYMGYAMEHKLKKQLKALEENNGWTFNQSELNGRRICAIDSKNRVMVMVRLLKNEVVVTQAMLIGVKEMKYPDIGKTDDEECCELKVSNDVGLVSFVFYQPGVDNVQKFKDLELFGKRWFNQAQVVAGWAKNSSRSPKVIVAV